MVGRADELTRLARLPDEEDAPAIALIEGEAGIGKTRLLRELCERLPEGTRVLAGQADPGTAGRPFELVGDALRHEQGGPPGMGGELTDPSRATREAAPPPVCGR